jgi:hypothetical protein
MHTTRLVGEGWWWADYFLGFFVLLVHGDMDLDGLWVHRHVRLLDSPP